MADPAPVSEIHQAAPRDPELDRTSTLAAVAGVVGSPTVSPVGDASPTAVPTETSTATALPTETPTVTPEPTETPQPTATPCAVAVHGGFSGIWAAAEERLGCPVQPAGVNQWVGEEAFERGRMFWRNENQKIYVLYQTGAWQRFDDTWNEHSDPEFTCGPAESPPTPKRGFGKLWCTRADVRSGLGQAVEEEHGEWVTVQDFVGGGLIVCVPSGTYVLYADGSWAPR